jgi:hypothetical protein
VFLVKSSPVKHQTLQQIQSNQVTPDYQAPPFDNENTVSEHTDEDEKLLFDVTFDDYKSQRVTTTHLECLEAQSLSSVYDDEDQTIYQWALS